MLLHTKPNGRAYSAEMAGAANLAARCRTSKFTISTTEAMEEPTPKRISLHSVRLATQNNMGDEDCEFGAGRGNGTPKTFWALRILSARLGFMQITDSVQNQFLITSSDTYSCGFVK